MVVDYADWNGRLVMSNDDATRQGNPILKCPQSNLWFGRWDDLRGFGRPAGCGGPWVADAVKANEPSEPFLLAGFERRVVHLADDAAEPVTFTLETDAAGNDNWTTLASVIVPARGYAYHVIPPGTPGEWIRVKTNRNVESATAYFHVSSGYRAADPALFSSLPAADQGSRHSPCAVRQNSEKNGGRQTDQRRPCKHGARSVPAACYLGQSEGILQAAAGTDMPLTLAATVVEASGKVAETGYYVMGADLPPRRVEDPDAEQRLRKRWSPKQDFEVDAASVIMKDNKGRRYRLPKGPDVFSRPAVSGWRRGIREVVTERNLMNIHGTFYEMPRPESGGLAKIRPITTHNRSIFDFASWRGLLG